MVGMKKEDFKFANVIAFEEGYLKKQSDLPEEERDRPRRKFDFSGRFGAEAGGGLRAEDLAIVRELAFSFSFPLTGRIECAHDKYADGWDPYVRTVSNPSKFARTSAGTGSHVYHARPVKDIFESDQSYTIGDPADPGSKPVSVLYDGHDPSEKLFTSWYQCGLDGFEKNDSGGYDAVAPSKRKRKPQDEDIVTGPFMCSEKGIHGGIVNNYASPSRVDIECLLLGLGLSEPDPSYEPEPLDKFINEGHEYSDPLSRGSFTFDHTLSDEYDRSDTTHNRGVKICRDMYVAVLDAAKSFHVVPKSEATALWELTKMKDGRHPRLSPVALTTLYDKLNGLVFVRTFNVCQNVDPGLRDGDDWYLSSENMILIRATRETKASRYTRIEHQGKCETTKEGDVSTTRCTFADPDYVDKVDIEPEHVGVHVQWNSHLVKSKSTHVYDAETGEGTTSCEWYQEKTLKQSNNLDGGSFEVSTPAGIPSCVSVSKVNLLMMVHATYSKIVEQNGFPTSDSNQSRIKDMRIPLKVEMKKKDTKFGRVFSGTISVKELQKAIDYNAVVPDGWFSSLFSADLTYAEVEFSLSVPQ